MGHRPRIVARHMVLSRARPVEAAEQVEQGGFAGAGLADDGHELAGPDREIDAGERGHSLLAHLVVAVDTLEQQQWRLLAGLRGTLLHR
ncbi:hypothetical protein HNR51_004337 [Methylorubrum thiocyanatum]|uniref:Uncharacterized protein n=1 Tax=Methylorubrum thiocyanatum TaxID=47958 RepID=A0AA40VCS0_9HYPH|nr:hypothetical protein [Methylorubrum thiocyanatum]